MIFARKATLIVLTVLALPAILGMFVFFMSLLPPDGDPATNLPALVGAIYTIVWVGLCSLAERFIFRKEIKAYKWGE